LRTAYAGEVILSAGAVNSPRILMLSGVGPVDDLKRLGIAVKAPSPDVGVNPQDHAQVPIMVERREKWGYYRDGLGFRMLVNGIRYLAFRDGPPSESGIESNSYFNPDDLNAAPTIQTFHNPALLSASLGKPLPKNGITFVNVVMQPRSRGDVRLRNDDPTSAPLINPNWFGDPEDVRKILGGLRYIRKVIAQPALKDVLYPEMTPGLDVENEDQLTTYVRSAARSRVRTMSGAPVFLYFTARYARPDRNSSSVSFERVSNLEKSSPSADCLATDVSVGSSLF
jgi:choline dehydrogenase-like flavoprotein